MAVADEEDDGLTQLGETLILVRVREELRRPVGSSGRGKRKPPLEDDLSGLFLFIDQVEA